MILKTLRRSFMKKIVSGLLIIIVLLIGIKIGSTTDIASTPSDLFESAKNEFEDEITKPNNKYENIELKPKEYLPNKIAKKINSIIEKLIEKIA